MITVRTVIIVASCKNWDLYQMDVNNSFLQGDLFVEVYMEVPQGFQRHEEYKVCKLIKSLYGLKQVSRQWSIKLTDALLRAGYKQSSYDHSLFTKKARGEIVIILVYVYNLLITGSCKELIQEAKTTLHNNFKVKYLGELRYLLGMI